MKKRGRRGTTLEQWLAEEMKDPEFRRHYKAAGAEINASRRLAALGGTMPKMKAPRRRRLTWGKKSRTQSDKEMKKSKIAGLIHLVRGRGVMLDEDLARMYGVPVKELNQKVQRNIRRFPPDFMFRLTAAEYDNLKSQMASGGRKRPRAFTEEGVAMLSTVLSSPCAIGVNVAIMRVQ